MDLFRKVLSVIVGLIVVLSPVVTVFSTSYTMTIECDPQTVDINSSAVICITLFDADSLPITGQDIFLGLDGIKGSFENVRITTDSDGSVCTTFYPKELSDGYIIAKTSIREDSMVQTIVSETYVSIEQINQLPVAVINNVAPNPANLGDTVTFKGSGSDLEGDVVAWIWDMGDGTTIKGSGDKTEISHIYQRSGEYKVTLRFKDEDGNWSKPAWVTLTILGSNAPTVSIQNIWPKLTVTNRELVLRCEILDIDGDLEKCIFDWGDGKTDEIDLKGSNAQLKKAHTYTSTGIYFIRIIATDAVGHSVTFPQKGWKLTVYKKARGDYPYEIYSSTCVGMSFF